MKIFRFMLILTAFLMLGSCGKPEIIFLHDRHFSEAAVLDVPLFSASGEKDFMKELRSAASGKGFRLKPVPVADEKDFAEAAEKYCTGKNPLPVIVTPYIYFTPEIRKQDICRNCLVVGPAAGIDESLEIRGKGAAFLEKLGSGIKEEGRETLFIYYDNPLCSFMFDAFGKGYGEGLRGKRLEQEGSTKEIFGKEKAEILITAGKVLSTLSNENISEDNRITLINYHSYPEFLSDRERKKVKRILYYDFKAAFITALETISSGESGKNIYCLELQDFTVPMP